MRAIAVVVVVTACSSTDAPTSATDSENDPMAVASTGGFLITTRTSGVSTDADGYEILMAPANAAGVFGSDIGINDSILISHQKLGPHASFWVQLRGMATNCWPTLVSWTQAATIRNQVTPIEFSVDCLASNRVSSFRRLTPLSAPVIAFHGSVTERYALSDEGRFRLQVTSARVGFFEYLGTYARLPANQLELTFEAEPSWRGSVVQRGDSLFVDYNDNMRASGFESGVFVRRLFR